MKFLFENWRGYLTEEAMGADNLPADTVVVINELGSETEIYYSSTSDMGNTDTKPFGRIIIEAPYPEGACDGAWNVVRADADHGWGPMLYDLAIEWATQNANGLMSDRAEVDQEAKKIWDFYLNNRKDVTAHQVGSENCDQDVAGSDLETSSLGKRYTKEPATMRILRSAGKLTTADGQPLEERCQKGYKTHEKRKTKKMYGKTYRNCVKAESVQRGTKAKPIIENWRGFLNEDDENVYVEGWGSIPAFKGRALRTVILPPQRRLIVIVKTRSEGPMAFYRSTGTGSSSATENMWVPMGGVGKRKDAAWIIKHPAGKMPKKGTELYMLGEWLQRSYEKKPFPEVEWGDWAKSKGFPSFQDVEKLTQNKVFRIEYGAMIVNFFLNKNKALKKDWCIEKCEGFYGAQLDNTKISGHNYSLRDIKNLK